MLAMAEPCFCESRYDRSQDPEWLVAYLLRGGRFDASSTAFLYPVIELVARSSLLFLPRAL